jgi:hypothetical protein
LSGRGHLQNVGENHTLRRVMLVPRAWTARHLPMAIQQGFAGLSFPVRIDLPQPRTRESQLQPTTAVSTE